MPTKPRSTERESPLLKAGLKPKETPSEEPAPTTPPSHPTTIARLKPEEERTTEKVTAYFTVAQFDRIEELQRAYRKKTGKRITVNALLRRMVETADIMDLI